MEMRESVGEEAAGGERALRQEVRAFVATERNGGTIPRYGLSWTHFDRAFSERCAARGYVAMTWPKAYAGHERTAAERLIVCEELLAAGAPLGSHWIADRQAGPQILRNGTEALKARVLPAMAAGRATCAIGMSEPDAGSDLASIRSRAEKCEGGWRLNGRKIWTTNAHVAEHMIVLCRTDPPEKAKQQGLSQLFVDMDSPGISVRPLVTLTGAAEFNEVLFEDVFVADEALLGAHGEGWRLVTEELAFERSGPDRFLSSFGVLRAAVDAAATTAESGAQLTLGRLVIRLASVRALSLEIARLLQAGASPRIEASMMKGLGTQVEQDIIEAARQILRERPGRGGSPEAAALAEAILSSPAFTLRGGTREILAGIVAKELTR